MSDPRTRIIDSRTLPAPPQPAADVDVIGRASTEVAERQADPNAATGDPEAAATRLIGKPHGNMRCVGLYLPRDADLELRRRAADTGLTLGEALMNALAGFRCPPSQHRAGGRRHRRQRVLDGSTVFVLLTIDEAQALSRLAIGRATSVSAICTEAILVMVRRPVSSSERT
jgi:hypothetical protein